MQYVTRLDEKVPKIGVGTWQMSTQETYNSVSMALEEGYRHVDTAQLYDNEAAVGNAIADADVDREELFLTTKVDPTHRSVEDIVDSVRGSVARLGVETVDLLLIHWPHPLADMETVVQGLNSAVKQGLARQIGVSNFDVDQLDRARTLSAVPIFTNQVRFHPWWPQRELLSYCQNHDVVLTAYSPLANGGAIGDKVLGEIGRRYDKSGPQVALRWVTQHEQVITIPMSTSRAHLGENIDVFDFMLTQAEHDRITRPSCLKTGISMAKGQLP